MQFTNVVIANAASVSTGAIDLWGQTIGGLIFPAAWTAADITFEACAGQAIREAPEAGDAAWRDLYDAAGTELVVQADTDRHVVIAPDAFRSVRWCRLRSGTSGTPVNQGAARTVGVVLLADTGS